MQLQEKILQQKINVTKTDNRPPVAIAHVKLMVSDVSIATNFFLKLGLRYIHQSENVAVLELRGGTHLVLNKANIFLGSGTNAPFDLMVDNVFATREYFRQLELNPSEIEIEGIHTSFKLVSPDGYIFKVTSSHTCGRLV
ncbi:MAG: VOC family protein [Scytonematopsis contorta HA4267-MV1]|jgi:catechol 2,3-dioxygenase-like lactoylglutathione lyase family enzyme|nr:VOC family protein [Scytonematopsis contorta HA4267-MV1]